MNENQNLPEEIEVTEEKKVEKTKAKKPNVFVRFGRFVKRFFRDYISEMKKVTWMSARDVRKGTILVAVSVVVVGLATLGIDSLFSFIIKWLGSLY